MVRQPVEGEVTYLQIHVWHVDGYPGDGVLGVDRRVSDHGGHRIIECTSALTFVQGIAGSSQVYIQIGGQHVVEQCGCRTSCELDVELRVGGKHWRCLIKLIVVVTQQVLSISGAESSEGVHGERQQITSICIHVQHMSRIWTGKQRFFMHLGQGFRHQQITRKQAGIAFKKKCIADCFNKTVASPPLPYLNRCVDWCLGPKGWSSAPKHSCIPDHPSPRSNSWKERK